MKASLGTFADGGSATIDLPRLLETRLLIQANSGGGKSWALRRLLEQTATQVQQLIIDPEGEFSSLREKFDLVICSAHGGDALAHPKTAQLLARRLLETRASAVLDLYDLKARERHVFVRLFLDALIDSPKSLWHPVLVALDEAQIFCPEKGQGESEATDSVIDLATRGRKRGLALVAATQRIGMFHKSAAAELKNKLIGSTGLDVDVKRAAFDLGLQPKEALARLRVLKAGTFFAFGPALHQVEPRELVVGAIETSHPKVGQRSMSPPKPTAAILAILPKLADLPQEAETQARSLEDLKKELAAARRELGAAKNTKPGASKAEVDHAYKDGYEAGNHNGYEKGHADSKREAAAIQKELLRDSKAAIDGVFNAPRQELSRPKPVITVHPQISRPPAIARSIAPAPKAVTQAAPTSGDMTRVQQKILDAIAELEQLGTAQPERELLAFMAGYSHVNSKGFSNAIGSLRSQGLIDGTRLTDSGREAAQPPARPRTPQELQDRIISMLGGASARVLRPLIDAYPAPVERQALAEAAGYGHVNSKGFSNAMGRFRTLGFIGYPDRGHVVAKPLLFLE